MKAIEKILYLIRKKDLTRKKPMTKIKSRQTEDSQIVNSLSITTVSTNHPEGLPGIHIQRTTMKNLTQDTLPQETNTKSKANPNHTQNKNTNQVNTAQKTIIAAMIKTNPIAIQSLTLHVTQSNTLESSILPHKNITKTENNTDLHRDNDSIATNAMIAIANTETIVNTENMINLLTTIKKNNPAFETIHDIKMNRVLTNMSQYKDNDQLTERNTLPEKNMNSETYFTVDLTMIPFGLQFLSIIFYSFISKQEASALLPYLETIHHSSFFSQNTKLYLVKFIINVFCA